MIEKRKELYIRHTIKKRKDILQRIDFNNVNITIIYKAFALYIIANKKNFVSYTTGSEELPFKACAVAATEVKRLILQNLKKILTEYAIPDMFFRYQIK